MKKNIFKNIFIKLARLLRYEIIDQNLFFSPTLNKGLDEELSSINKKSIVLPLGEVKIIRKIKSLLVIFRTNTDIEIWNQNKKRIFEKPKIEYSLRSLNSLIKSINFCKEKHSNINFKIVVVDDKSKNQNILKIKKLLFESNLENELINLNHVKYEGIIKKQKNDSTFSNLSSLLNCFEIGKIQGDDLIFFVEDDYLHFKTSIEEMLSTYERISSQIDNELFMCPADYPYLYMSNQKTNVLIGSKRHWRTVNQTLCTFLTSKKLIDKYWDNFYKNCLDSHNPFEKYLNEIYKNEICISPLKSLSVHMTNINSSYGLAPFINYKKIWDENETN